MQRGLKTLSSFGAGPGAVGGGGGTFPTWKEKKINTALLQPFTIGVNNTVPSMVCIASDDNIVHSGGSTVAKYNITTGISLWSKSTGQNVTGMVIGPDDTVYCTKALGNTIVKIDAAGTLTNMVTSAILESGCKVIRFINGFLYIGEPVGGNIRKIALDGTVVWTVTTPGSYVVNDLRSDNEGNILVAVHNTATGDNLFRLNPANGSVISPSYFVRISTAPDGWIKSFVVDSNNDIYCTNITGNTSVYKLTAASNYNGATPVFNLAIGTAGPVWLTKTDIDEFLVFSGAGSNNAYIRRFDKDGVTIYNISTMTPDVGIANEVTAPAYRNGAFALTMVIAVNGINQYLVKRYVDKITF